MRLPQNAPPRKSFQIKRYIVVIIVSVIAILFAVILWFVYPKTHLNKGRHQLGGKPDKIANLYLRHEMEKRPNDLSLRLQLIHQELALGELKTVNELIKPYLEKHPTTQTSWQFYWYAYQAKFVQATAKPKKKNGFLKPVDQKKQLPKKKVSKAELKQLMQQLRHAPITTAQMITLTDNAVAFKFYRLARSIGEQLIQKKQHLTDKQLSKMAKNEYLSGNFLLSAQFYMAAVDKTTAGPSKKKYYIEAINSLLAGNLLPNKFNLIKPASAQFKDDPEVLGMLAKAALASKQPKLAAYWMRQAIGLQYITSSGGD